MDNDAGDSWPACSAGDKLRESGTGADAAATATIFDAAGSAAAADDAVAADHAAADNFSGAVSRSVDDTAGTPAPGREGRQRHSGELSAREESRVTRRVEAPLEQPSEHGF